MVARVGMYDFEADFGVCPPCAAKMCAARPVFARVVGEPAAADPRICVKWPWLQMLGTEFWEGDAMKQKSVKKKRLFTEWVPGIQ